MRSIIFIGSKSEVRAIVAIFFNYKNYNDVYVKNFRNTTYFNVKKMMC